MLEDCLVGACICFTAFALFAKGKQKYDGHSASKSRGLKTKQEDTDNLIAKELQKGAAAHNPASIAAAKLRSPLEDEDGQSAAVEEMVRIGAESASYLALLLRDKNRDVRIRAAQGLGRLGPAAKQYVKELAALLIDPYSDVREMARWAMGEITMDR
eukprot:gnl/TRDRNA2_/TRDRNA2_199696_c0_seq1.p1 gnl/TRDRNA2_/TRDRNA2_199696_c0~~gnl/TRDRNA2_/TRDRNA2_199696_c0_seq1.p1  ORF type:complete len:157 (-),score=26.36 gnl/TRDRNA2_/TRDRNA2_199696_c0_seq1:116-586(-)